MKKILFILLLPLTLFGQSQKISDMTSATTLAGTEYVPIVQTTNKKATVSLLRGFGSYGTAGQYMTVNGSANGFTFVTPPFISSVGTGVANELTYWSGTNTLGSLATATYPSLTELSYVKGITSAIQTQLNAKGVGDMLLGSAQTNTGTKTFLDGSFKLRNVANTFDAIFSNTNTANRTYTFPDASGTVALTSNLGGWLTGTLTGNVGINGSDIYDVIFGNPTAGQGIYNFAVRPVGSLDLYSNVGTVYEMHLYSPESTGGLYGDIGGEISLNGGASSINVTGSSWNVLRRLGSGSEEDYIGVGDYGGGGTGVNMRSTNSAGTQYTEFRLTPTTVMLPLNIDNTLQNLVSYDPSSKFLTYSSISHSIGSYGDSEFATLGDVLTYDGAGNTYWSTPYSGIYGDVTKVGTPLDNQIGVWTGDGTIEGTTGLTYDGSNLQLTGDIGSTGTRITKGWFTDLQVTNAIAGSITGNAATVTTNANLTGAVTSTGNATSLGSFTVAQLSTAISDANISGTNTGDQTSIVGITGSLAEFNTALTGADFATGGGTATGTNTGDQSLANTSDATSHTVTLTGGTSVQLIEGSNITLTTGGTGGAGTVTIASTGGGSGDMVLASVQTSTGKKTFQSDATNAGINFGSGTADPSSLTTGDVWVSSANSIKERNNGTTTWAMSATALPTNTYIPFGTNTGLFSQSSSLTWNGTTLNATQFNGVALTTGGSATKYLSEDGTYTTPAGGSGLTYAQVKAMKFK